LGPAARLLCRIKVLTADKVNWHAPIGTFYPVQPNLFEIYSCDAHDNVDAVGFHSNLVHQVRIGQIRCTDIRQWSIETLKSSQDSLRILQTWPDENIQVLCVTGLGVVGDGIGTDDEVFNLFF
jgi:hypothetical protein